ncbi:MAG TPA: MliC family protein, partial [Burkholderiaceae bacterium]|nr:MliC family protein [Burkholderiaceae bacterium]
DLLLIARAAGRTVLVVEYIDAEIERRKSAATLRANGFIPYFAPRKLDRLAPGDPGAFNLEFLDGGQLAVQLDCNTGGASWQQSGRSLAIGPVKSTRKACPAASEADRFGRQLVLVRGAVQSMGLLELALGDAGTMVMARDPDWRLRSFDCPNGAAPVLVAFGRDRAIVRWRDEAWQMKPQPTASGVRYSAESAILFSKGNEASLVSQGRQVAGPCVARR